MIHNNNLTNRVCIKWKMKWEWVAILKYARDEAKGDHDNNNNTDPDARHFFFSLFRLTHNE